MFGEFEARTKWLLKKRWKKSFRLTNLRKRSWHHMANQLFLLLGAGDGTGAAARQEKFRCLTIFHNDAIGFWRDRIRRGRTKAKQKNCHWGGFLKSFRSFNANLSALGSFRRTFAVGFGFQGFFSVRSPDVIYLRRQKSSNTRFCCKKKNFSNKMAPKPASTLRFQWILL